MTEVSFQGLVANLGFSDGSGLQGGRDIHMFTLMDSPLIGKLRHGLHWRPFGFLEHILRNFRDGFWPWKSMEVVESCRTAA